jgi:hypothetical protein
MEDPMNLVARQLVGTWVVGSVTTGTLAVLFTLDRGRLPVQSVDTLPLLSLLGVLGMLVALVAALGLLAWVTMEVTWLPVTWRGRTMWVIVVGAGGLAGCLFAAAATFAGEYSLGAQLVLAYVGGGLPFALVAAMLLGPPRTNAAPLAGAVVLLVIGTVIMDGAPLQACTELLWRLMGSSVTFV